MRLLLILCAVLFVGGPINAAEPTPVSALIVTGGHGYNTNAFFDMFESVPSLRFAKAEQTRASSPAYDRADLFDHDVVVLYDMVQAITPEQQKRFVQLTEKGIGLVVLHHALVSHQDWPEYERIIGGIYPEPQDKRGKVSPELGYEHDVDIPVVIAAKDHPVTAGLTNFMVHDEIYWGFRTAKEVTPLLTTTHPKSGKPLAWAKQEGKSRIVFIQLGHGPGIFKDSNYRRLIAQSIAWTARR